MKHIALWGAWYGSHNVGDQVLLLTITDILARVIGDGGTGSSVRFTVLTNNPAHVLNYTRLESRCQVEAWHNRKQFPRLMRALADCDLFIFGGGVPFYDDRAHVLAMAFLVGIARLMRLPYMTWTVSSQVVQDPFAKRVFGWAMNGASAITYRDEHTHQLFQSCGVTRPMQLTADPGFWLEAAPQEQVDAFIERNSFRQPMGEAAVARLDPARPWVALTPRTLRSRDGEAETHYNPKTQTQFEQEIACFAAALDWLWEQGYQPVFVPMNTVAPDDDRIASRLAMEAAAHGDRALLLDEEIRPRLAPALYQRCQASFVARVHGSITSMVANCPVMMYAFAPKHAGIMASMGLEAYSLLEAEATPQRAIQMLADLLTNRQKVISSMAQRLEILQQEALIPAQLAVEILQGQYLGKAIKGS